MHTSTWTKSDRIKMCTGCDVVIEPGSRYLHAKFSIDYPHNNVTKLISINLCETCISEFEDYAKDPRDVVNNVNKNEPI